MSVEKLQQLELHDMPVSSLAFDFISGQLLIGIEQYVDAIETYRPVRLTFQQVSKLKATPLWLEADVEWYSSDIQLVGVGFDAQIILLTGGLSFRFGQVVVDL
ncbi:MAG: hypothetical protein ACRYFZ_02365 [Janthinobacterium lividum]